VEAPGFKKRIETKVKLDVGKSRVLDLDLEAGNIAEVVTVESVPLSVQLTTPTASTVVSGDQVRRAFAEQPQLGATGAAGARCFQRPGRSSVCGNDQSRRTGEHHHISVNGARSAQNTYRVDGADITDRGSNITIQAYPALIQSLSFSVVRSLLPGGDGGQRWRLNQYHYPFGR